jgi:hypothetical protein
LGKLLFSTQFLQEINCDETNQTNQTDHTNQTNSAKIILQTIISSVQFKLFNNRAWYHNSLFFSPTQNSNGGILRTKEWLSDLLEHYPEIQFDYQKFVQ